MVKVQLMGPLPEEAFLDEEIWGPNKQAVMATQAGYDQNGRMVDLEKGEDRMKKHAVVFWTRYHELSETHMDAVINLNYPVDSHRNDKKRKDLQNWSTKWQNQVVGSGEKSLFFIVVAFEVTIFDFYANLSNLKRTFLLSLFPAAGETQQDVAARRLHGRKALASYTKQYGAFSDQLKTQLQRIENDLDQDDDEDDPQLVREREHYKALFDQLDNFRPLIGNYPSAQQVPAALPLYRNQTRGEMKQFWTDRWSFELCYNLYSFAADTLMLEACYNSNGIGRMMRETFQQSADDMWRLVAAPRLMNNMVEKIKLIENVVEYTESRDLVFDNFRTMERSEFNNRNYDGIAEMLVPAHGPFRSSVPNRKRKKNRKNGRSRMSKQRRHG